MIQRGSVVLACLLSFGCARGHTEASAVAANGAAREIRLAGTRMAAWNTAVRIFNESGFVWAGSEEDVLRFRTAAADAIILAAFDSLSADSLRVRIGAHSYHRDAPTPRERIGNLLSPGDPRWDAVNGFARALAAECEVRCRDPLAGAVPVIDRR